MSAIPPVIFTTLLFVMAVTPMLAALMWSLGRTRSMSEIIQEARR